jgi:hypothetical protein
MVLLVSVGLGFLVWVLRSLEMEMGSNGSEHHRRRCHWQRVDFLSLFIKINILINIYINSGKKN